MYYPLNLIEKIFDLKNEDLDLAYVEKNFDKNLKEAYEKGLIVLSEREYDIITSQLSRKELANKYNVSQNRIQQIIQKVVKKLSYPSYRKYIQYGVEYVSLENLVLRKKECLLKQLDELNNSNLSEKYIGIEEIGLSPKTFIRLKRAGINDVNQLRGFSFDELVKLNKMGKKSAREIETALKSIGLK